MHEPFGWQRSSAPSWVWNLCCLITTLLTLWVLFAALAALSAGVGPAALLILPVMAVFPALSGWVTRAWRHGREWAWWVLVILSGVGLAYALLDTAVEGPGVGVVAGVGLNTLALVLLTRPSSRAWVRRPVDERQGSAVP